MISRSAGKPGSPEELRRYDLLLAGFDLLDQAIAVFDAAPKLVTWNKAMLRLLDFPEDLVRVGTPFEEFVRFNLRRGEYADSSAGKLDEADIERRVAERMAAVRAFLPHHAERTRPNGQVLSIRGVPIPNLGFVTLWTDITEQRRYEQLIESQNAELETRVRARTAELEAATGRIDKVAAQLARSEERLRLIMDAIPAMIAYVDAGQRYRFANKGYTDWFGIDKTSIRGKTIAEVIGSEAYAQVRPYLEQAHSGEQVSYEYSRTNAAGRQVYARSAVVPEAAESGGVRGFFVLSIDITEQKASQAALIQAQKMEAVGQLTGGLAHDFNNLLTVITGNLATLKDKLPAHQGFENHLEPALAAARRGAELIRRLLTFSRQQSLDPCPVEVGALVHGMMQLLSRSLTERIAIRLDLPTEKLHALIDPHQLESALLNLAINARDAMPDGGRLSIAVARRHIPKSLALLVDTPPGDYVQFDVADTGTGIAPEHLPRVFEPFFTTKSFGAGSGLGLAMVYGFIRQSGGNIRILSTPGVGTSVRFIVPMTDAPVPAPAPARHTADGADASRLVLLVEDDPEVRKVIRQQLTELGYPVLEAANGVDAGTMLEAVEDIALLVSDTVMPGMGGRELAALARRLRPQLPILLITGYATGEAPAAMPDIPTLRKPFERAGLADAIATAVAAAVPPETPAP